MIDQLLLLSGNDIPFQIGKVIIHQPTLKEIAYITEKSFWIACEILKFNKSKLSSQEEQEVQNISDLKLIMAFILQKTTETKKIKNDVTSLLALLFPDSSILLSEAGIQIGNENQQYFGEINENNFQEFKQILIKMFCLNNSDNKQYNPNGSLAEKIANQIRRGQQKRAQLAPKQEESSFLGRYVSALAIAQRKSIKQIMDYTIYQLMDEFNRFMLYKSNEQWFSMKLAGASGLDTPQNWLKDIH